MTFRMKHCLIVGPAILTFSFSLGRPISSTGFRMSVPASATGAIVSVQIFWIGFCAKV